MMCTGWTEWMSHRKLKETKQQPGTARPANILGCCLVSFHFRCDIHPIRPVLLSIERKLVLYLIFDTHGFVADLAFPTVNVKDVVPNRRQVTL